MRKRWVWIGVAATALILAVFAFLPREPDGLDFIRKYRPRSERLTSSEWRRPAWRREFAFEVFDPELGPNLEILNTLEKERYAYAWLPDSVPTKIWTLRVYLKDEPPWLVQQWQNLMNRIAGPQAPISPLFDTGR
ncbi:MAG: hypothetical protein H7Y17_14975 [Chlorobia bacterium]|nr:hypothetical protein [Fimbriimonadaceae bacterium]